MILRQTLTGEISLENTLTFVVEKISFPKRFIGILPESLIKALEK